jgi:hypothetical protein
MKLFLILLSLSFSLSAAESFGQKIKPFINKYCVDCHGPKKQKSNLRLDTLSTELNDLKTASEWQTVLDEMNNAAMPPEDENQPSLQELSSAIEALTYSLEDAKKKLHGKDRKIVMRRLNQREYINTIEELTGVKLKEEKVLEDEQVSGFDTNGKSLIMSAYQLEHYMSLGKHILDLAIFTEKPKLMSKDILSINRHNLLLERQLKNYETKAKDKTEIKALKNYLNTAGTKDHIFLSPFLENGKLGNTLKKCKVYFPSIRGVPMTPGYYKYTLTLGAGGTKPGDRVMVHVLPHSNDRSKQEIYSLFEITNPYQKPQKIEFEVYLTDKRMLSIEPKIHRSGKNLPFLAIKNIHIEGPIYSQWPPVSHQKIFPFAQDKMSEKLYAEKVIRTFAAKAFKGRTASDNYFKTLMQIYHTNRENGASLEDALKEPLAVILSSPKFLYTIEEKTKSLPSRLFAERLASFIWSSRPDKELYAMANNLSSPKVLQAQITRMLKDPKGLNLAKGFVPQWLTFNKLDIVDVDRKTHPKYNDHVKKSVRLEPIHFFHTIAQNNLSLENFIDSDFVVADNVMKQFYGLPSNGKDDFEPVKIDSKSGRGGLLGQAATLIMTGNGVRSSPVMRGEFVIAKMLGMHSPEPPPNVPQLKTGRKSTSVRKALDAHKAQAQCSACHKRIDPAGYGLEVFDASGILRSHKENIDTIGQLPDSAKYKDLFEMKQLLLKRKDSFAKSFIENLMSYAYGRTIGFADAKTVDSIAKNSKRKNYKLAEIIARIVYSKEFRMK